MLHMNPFNALQKRLWLEIYMTLEEISEMKNNNYSYIKIDK